MRRMLATLAVLASACLAAASTAGAVGTGKVCPTFKQGRLTFHPETLGTGWTCESAKPWIVKLIGDRVHVGSRNVPLTNGPGGYHCLATPLSRSGHATSGACFKGTIAFPRSGFAWITG
jgi:hypothetical protein